MIPPALIPYLFFSTVGACYCALWTHIKNESQMLYDIDEYKRTGQPLQGTVTQRRWKREAAEHERWHGESERRMAKEKDEWARIRQLK